MNRSIGLLPAVFIRELSESKMVSRTILNPAGLVAGYCMRGKSTTI